MDEMEDFRNVPTSYAIAGIPNSHYDSHLCNFANKYSDRYPKFFQQLIDLFNLIMTFDLQKCPRYVFFCGSPGCGKTHFMVGLYRAMVAALGYSQGTGPLYTPFTAMTADIVRQFGEGLYTRTTILGYLQANWLMLDDFTAGERVFKEGTADYNIFRDILIDRYDRANMLITSSNLNADDLLPELDRMFGAYVTSRLGNSVILQFPNMDLRKVRV